MEGTKRSLACALIAAIMLISVLPVLAPGAAGAGPLPAWSTYTIYSVDDVGSYSSIGLDSNDFVHISYHDSTNGYLMYATNKSGVWTNVALETGAYAGQETSLAVDANDYIHMVYYNYPNSNLKYATNEGGGWVKIGIDTAGDVGRFASLALDSIGNTHISYYDATNGNLKYATNSGGSWALSVVDSTNDVGWYSSIAVDHNDIVHISYYDNTNGDLRYATNPGGVWTTTSIDTAGTVGVYSSIGVDSTNKAHICYWDATTGFLKYATNEEGAWRIELISDTAINGIYTDLIVDEDDVVHMVFYDSLNGDIWYANDAWDGWTLGAVDTSGNVGRYPSMALDSLNNVHVTYYDVTNMNLRYSHQVLVAPTTPLELMAAAGDAQVTLSWTEPTWDGGSPITGYKVYRGSESGGETLLTTIGDVQWYEDTTAVNGETYWYYVVAVNAIGESTVSNEVSVVPMALPSQPMDVQVIPGNGQAMLTWDAPTDDGGSTVQYYVLYRGQTNGGEIPLLAVYGSTSFLDAGLTNGVTYWYYVTAVNAVGEGAASNEVSAVPMTHASAPTDLQAIAGMEDIGLGWSPPASNGGSAITNYEVYRGVTSGNKSLLITLGNVTTYLDTSVEPGVGYYYYVTAVNSAGESVASNEASSVIVIPPSSPLSLMAMASDEAISLTWSAPSLDGGSSVTGYEVHRGNASGEETYLTSVGETNYTDTGLENGMEFFYIVKAVNIAGAGSASYEVSAIPAAVPSAPQELQASADPSNIIITWTAPTDDGGSPVSGYMVYRGEEASGEELLATIGAVTSYQDDTAQVGQEYWYYVRAVNALGEGPASNEATTIIRLAPSAPLELQAVAGDSIVFLGWTSPSEDGGAVITGYEIFRGNVSGEEAYLTTVTSTNHTDSEVQNGATYFYYVLAVNSEGSGAASNEVSAMPMAVPSNDSVLIAVAGDSQIELAWSAPSHEGGVPIIGYVIYRGMEEGSEEFLVGTGNVLSFIDAGLSNGQTYWYYITAVNQAGEGPSSNKVSATPSSVPGAPRSMQAVAGASAITLTWLAPENDGGSQITNFQVYRGPPGEEVLLSTVGSVLTYADSAVEVGREYWYSVVAVNFAGAGAMSEFASAIILGTPSAPLGLEATRGQDFVVLTWEAPMDDGGSPIVVYSIYRGTESGGEEFLVQVGDVLSFMDDEASAGSTYWYYVTANNSAGESEASSEASISLQSVATAPSDLVAVPGDGMVLLNWTTPSDDGGAPITGYKVFRVNESGEAVLVASVTSAGYTDEGLINGEAYAYFVVATNTIGDGAPSEPVITTPQAPERGQFDWVLWLHIILLIVALVLLTYYYVKRKKEEGEGSEKEGGEKVQ